MPDGFLGTNLAKAAASEAAADRKRERDEFATDERRDAHDRADDGPRVRARQQSGQKRSCEREVGCVVINEQSRDDPSGQRNTEARGKDQAFGPIPLLGEENPAKPRKSHQHRRQHRDNRHFDDERRQEELPGRQRFRGLWHLMVNYNWLTA